MELTKKKLVAVDILRSCIEKELKDEKKVLELCDEIKEEMLFESAFQILLDEFLRDDTHTTVDIGKFLDLSITLAKNERVVLTTPYSILSDAMEAQSILKCHAVWQLLEERKDILTSSPFVVIEKKNSTSSLYLLRLCNTLLRRLSKADNAVFCGKILMFLSHTFSLKERSGLNIKGSSNETNTTDFEDEQTYTESGLSIDGEAVETGPIDYKLYKGFWSLQRFFRSYDKAIESAAHWEKFVTELDMVLSAFEGNAFSVDDLERAKESRNTTHYFQPKYLTNGRLLQLQLRDPVLRECMLTQFLVVCTHLLEANVPLDVITPKSKLIEFQERVDLLLESNPPDGHRFKKILAHVLERETNWINWKAHKCPDFERQPTKWLSNWASSKKRKHDDDDSTNLKRPSKKRGSDGLLDTIIHENEKASLLEGLSKPDRALHLDFEGLQEEFVEAWDPENAIEEQYWPDKNKITCWRTMRGTWRNQVAKMQYAKDGADEIVRQIKGIEKPKAKTPPAHEVEESSVEEDGTMDTTEGNGTLESDAKENIEEPKDNESANAKDSVEENTATDNSEPPKVESSVKEDAHPSNDDKTTASEKSEEVSTKPSSSKDTEEDSNTVQSTIVEKDEGTDDTTQPTTDDTNGKKESTTPKASAEDKKEKLKEPTDDKDKSNTPKASADTKKDVPAETESKDDSKKSTTSSRWSKSNDGTSSSTPKSNIRSLRGKDPSNSRHTAAAETNDKAVKSNIRSTRGRDRSNSRHAETKSNSIRSLRGDEQSRQRGRNIRSNNSNRDSRESWDTRNSGGSRGSNIRPSDSRGGDHQYNNNNKRNRQRYDNNNNNNRRY